MTTGKRDGIVFISNCNDRPPRIPVSFEFFNKILIFSGVRNFVDKSNVPRGYNRRRFLLDRELAVICGFFLAIY